MSNLAENVIWFVVGAIVSGLIQLFVAIIFEHSARTYYRRARRIYLLIANTLSAKNLGVERERYRIGISETPVVILEGTPAEPYLPSRITCHLEEQPLVLSPELQLSRNLVEIEQQAIENKNGKRDFHNGAMVAFTNYHHSYTHVWEEPTLTLWFKKTDYYTFLATAMKLEDVVPSSSNPSETVRVKHLHHDTYRYPDPNFATSFGVNLAVITSDNYLAIAKRGERGVSHYHGVHAVPVMESVNPEKDKDIYGQLDVYETAKRGVFEELGGIKVDKSDINIFTLQVDVRWYLYGLNGFVRLEHSRDEISGIRTRGIREWWESPDISFISFDPQTVAQYVRNAGGVSRFHPASFVSIIQTLIYHYNQKEVHKAFA